MNVSDYDLFVRETDQSHDADVALYGIVGELGSVVSAVKRRMIASTEDWNVANQEIIEELGDLIWYCFALAQCHSAETDRENLNLLTHDIANLRKEIGSDDERAERIGNVLGSHSRDEFLSRAADFPQRATTIRFDDYQELAFLTARTTGKTLLEVCLAILTQLCAELLRRRKLPEIEIILNKNLADRRIEDVLGEITWHIAAIATLYDLSLDKIVHANREKLSRRYGLHAPTRLFDGGSNVPEHEKLPRNLEVCFVSTGPGRLQMYCRGRRLGDPLTDNAQDEDGYRFHDIFHLALAAKLGWSPILRKLLGLKRKSNPSIDEYEDGARAQIVEEAVINAIHAEGLRQAQSRLPAEPPDTQRLFATKSEISFDLLKLIKHFVRKNEVSRCLYWEWVEAIYDGCSIFHDLRREQQGTVTVDLEKRSIAFRPTVHLALRGQVSVLGSAAVDSTSAEPATRKSLVERAILDALGVGPLPTDHHPLIEIDETTEAGLSVKAHGRAKQAMWDQEVLEFRITVLESRGQLLSCTAVGMSDLS